MTGSASIDLKLENIWKSWWSYRKGKKASPALEEFEYHLEENLQNLSEDLAKGTYQHGSYRTFIVAENKRREISVAAIRDRVVHRLLYDYLVPIFDHTFVFDAWSCRKTKGLLGAIERTQDFLKSFPNHYVWRADIRKFFDHVDRDVLLTLLKRRVTDAATLSLLQEVIFSYPAGIPIGNLTSQIFANIYLNELDRFVTNDLKSSAYLRYGDDFLVFDGDPILLKQKRDQVEQFLKEKLKLTLHPTNDQLLKAKQGLHFLGVRMYPSGRTLNDRAINRATTRLNSQNLSSYWGLIAKHCNAKENKKFLWETLSRMSLI